jgi:hypothetical protein
MAIAACLLAVQILTGAGGTTGEVAEAHWRAPVGVAVDADGRMYVDGARVDTLEIHRGQIVYWKKRDPAGGDLVVQFERKLFHRRNRVRVRLTEDGKSRFLRVSAHARLRMYFGNPEKGFSPETAAPNSLRIRVIAPPETK